MPTNTGLPFTEDFEDGVADGFIPYNDKATPGPWVVVADGAGKVYQPQAAVSALEFAVGGSTKWTDVAMTLKVRLNSADTDAQIILRFKEPKTYLVLEMAEGKYKLRGRAAGSTTDLISPSPKPVITAGTWYTVGITVKGTTVSLTLDGTAIGSPVMCNAAISNGGVAFGMDSGSASFDDLSVTAAP
jgi:Concanavalin A-like lectin/glucanases superfamily